MGEQWIIFEILDYEVFKITKSKMKLALPPFLIQIK